MTSEHAYHWKKFEQTAQDVAEEILQAGSSETALQLARARGERRIKDWDEIKLKVMKEILRSKLSQHEDVRQALRKTGQREIIENSPVDDYWGIGPNGNGKNWLGRIWMELREEL